MWEMGQDWRTVQAELALRSFDASSFGIIEMKQKQSIAKVGQYSQQNIHILAYSYQCSTRVKILYMAFNSNIAYGFE